MIHVLKTIDAHVAGEPLRLVTEGLPQPAGKTMAQKRDWMKRHADHLRRAVVLRRPRGHRDMRRGVARAICPGRRRCRRHLHAERRLRRDLRSRHHRRRNDRPRPRPLRFESQRPAPQRPTNLRTRRLCWAAAAGTVYARGRMEVRGEHRRVDSVTFTNVPSFVVSGGHAVRLGTRDLKVDIAFGGVFYAIVDTEAIGIPLTAARLPELRRLGVEIRASINAAARITHPVDADASGVAGVIFTGPPENPEAHLRNVTIFADGAARSFSVRDRHVGGDGRPRCRGAAPGRSAVRPRKRARNAPSRPALAAYAGPAIWPAASSRRSKAPRGSRLSTRSTWTTTIRCGRDLSCKLLSP